MQIKFLNIFFFVFVSLLSLSSYALSIDDLKKELSGIPPMNVGFDIDDTLLFASPAFYRNITKYCKDDPDTTKGLIPGKKCDETKLWLAVNTSGVDYSPPKYIGKELIDFHQSRGDNIWFITRRVSSKKEFITENLAKVFNIKNVNKVIFTNLRDKSQSIKENNIKIYYGDSDTDIEDAQKVGSRGIRVERAPNSHYKAPYNPGIYKEDIIDNSAN